MILQSLRKEMCARLEQAGISNSAFEADLLLKAVLKVSKAELVLAFRSEIDPEKVDLLLDYVRRRTEEYVPIGRLLGQRGFWTLEFGLSKDTLEPRPDTEILIEEALLVLQDQTDTKLKFLDLGTGSGCILLSLLSEFPKAVGVGLDISQGALDQARENAVLNKLQDRVNFVLSDGFSALTKQDQFDLIVSNPPYIPSADILTLSQEVQKHDPMRALDGGEDGLVFYRLIAEQASKYLKAGGHLIVEFGIGQEAAVQALFEQAGFCQIQQRKDYGGIVRTIRCQKPI